MRNLAIATIGVLLAGCATIQITSPDGTIIKGKVDAVYALLKLRSDESEAEAKRAHELALAQQRAAADTAILSALNGQNLSEQGEVAVAMALNTRYAMGGAQEVVAAGEMGNIAEAKAREYGYYQYRRDTRFKLQDTIFRGLDLALRFGHLWLLYDRSGGGDSDISQRITIGDGNTFSNSSNPSGGGEGEAGFSSVADGERNMSIGSIGSGQGMDDSFVASWGEDIWNVRPTNDGSSAQNLVFPRSEFKGLQGDDLQGASPTIDDSGDGSNNSVGLVPFN